MPAREAGLVGGIGIGIGGPLQAHRAAGTVLEAEARRRLRSRCKGAGSVQVHFRDEAAFLQA